MPANEQVNRFLSSKIVIAAAILVAGLCWYFSIGLSGDSWWLLWLAPIPVLLVSFRTSAKACFIISFIAYLIGRLSWFSYLVRVATIIPAIIFTLLLPLVFAFIMVLTRRTILKSNSWSAVFTFPVFFTCFELLAIKFSADGTAGSIAYSQSNFLPLIQIASVTGILGITFLVCFIPSVISMGFHYRNEKIKLRNIMIAAAVILLPVLLFGIVRMNNDSGNATIKAGLVVVEEKFHNITDHPETSKENLLAENYIKEISALAAQGAQVIVLPERAINITKETAGNIIAMFAKASKENHVCIVTGYTNFRSDQERNSALVIDMEGNVATDYNKVHLVNGLETQFTPGKEPALFKLGKLQAGTAICKDLDFDAYIKEYGKNRAAFICVPAWDFIVDDWLHCRMAILRGVENGFSEIRTARQGRLTISDCYGRVTAEASCSQGNKAVLLGTVSTQRMDTIYTGFGDWFGIINLIGAFYFIFIGRRNKSAV